MGHVMASGRAGEATYTVRRLTPYRGGRRKSTSGCRRVRSQRARFTAETPAYPADVRGVNGSICAISSSSFRGLRRLAVAVTSLNVAAAVRAEHSTRLLSLSGIGRVPAAVAKSCADEIFREQNVSTITVLFGIR